MIEYTTYRDMGDKLRWCEPFRGNSASGYGDDRLYQVRSYGALIGLVLERDRRVILNAEKYSTTTSRLQNLLRRVSAERGWEVEEVSDEELELLEDAVAFKNIQNMPQRVKCALLSWKTLDQTI